MKEQFTTTVNVSGKGDSKDARLCRRAKPGTDRRAEDRPAISLLRIEPQDVKVVQAQEAVRRRSVLFFFLRGKRRSYSVELDMTVNVR